MKWSVTILLVIIFLVPALAQDSVQSKLSFKEAVSIGLENNLNLNQQENLLISSRVSKTAGLLSIGPSLSINGNAGRNDGNSFIQQEGSVVNGVTDFVNASIDASMPLFQGFNAVNTYRQSSSLYEAQLHRVKRTNQDVIREVSRLYLLCLLDQQLVVINMQNLEAQQKQYEQIAAYVEAGIRAEVDLKNQEFQVKNAELLVVRAKNTLRNDKALLAQTIQLDPAIPFDLAEPTLSTVDYQNISLDDLYKAAFEHRSDLQTAKSNEEATRFGMKATRGTYFPSIRLFASYGSAYNYIYRNEVLTDVENRSFAQQFRTDNKQLTYGVSFSIPIFGGFQTRSAVVRNKILHENAKLESENTELLVKSEVLLAYQNLQDAQSAFQSAEAQLTAAETSYGLEKERYALGISDIVALTQSVQSYTRAKADYESARYTLMFQNILINYATGTLKIEDIQ